MASYNQQDFTRASSGVFMWPERRALAYYAPYTGYRTRATDYYRRLYTRRKRTQSVDLTKLVEKSDYSVIAIDYTTKMAKWELNE